MKKVHLLISFSFFKFQSIKKNDEQNIQNNFVYSINCKFNEIYKTCNDNINLFHQNLLGNNNKLLFYTGLENNVKEIIEQHKEVIIKWFDTFFQNEQMIDSEHFYVKTKIGKNSQKQQFSLASLLIMANYKNTNIDINNEEILRIYFLFPIKCDDFH